MALIMSVPPRLEPPVIIEPVGIQDVYADGGVVRSDGLWQFTTLYVREGGERIAILRIRMLRHSSGPPCDGFDASLIRAYVECLTGRSH